MKMVDFKAETLVKLKGTFVKSGTFFLGGTFLFFKRQMNGCKGIGKILE